MSVDPRVETIRLLTSIDQSLRALVAVMSPPPPSGDPVVKAKDPRDWTGEPMKGRKFSECPPEYLDLLAARYDFFAGKEVRSDEDAQQVRYAKIDGDRARAWAAKLRSGWTPPAAPTMEGGGGF